MRYVKYVGLGIGITLAGGAAAAWWAVRGINSALWLSHEQETEDLAQFTNVS